jgi:PIN domain nuclease of toxin-antitoxin system
LRLLLDSHAIFWVMLDDPRLSEFVRDLVTDPANECLISPVSHWEMALKISVGKFRIADDFQTLWREACSRFAMLPIEAHHSVRLIDLPFHHRDPFDRMLVAQALAEGIPLASSDKGLDAYGVRRLW